MQQKISCKICNKSLTLITAYKILIFEQEKVYLCSKECLTKWREKKEMFQHHEIKNSISYNNRLSSSSINEYTQLQETKRGPIIEDQLEHSFTEATKGYVDGTKDSSFQSPEPTIQTFNETIPFTQYKGKAKNLLQKNKTQYFIISSAILATAYSLVTLLTQSYLIFIYNYFIFQTISFVLYGIYFTKKRNKNFFDFQESLGIFLLFSLSTVSLLTSFPIPIIGNSLSFIILIVALLDYITSYDEVKNTLYIPKILSKGYVVISIVIIAGINVLISNINIAENKLSYTKPIFWMLLGLNISILLLLFNPKWILSYVTQLLRVFQERISEVGVKVPFKTKISKLKNITKLFIDRDGTLTPYIPEVSGFITFEPFSEMEIKQIISAIEDYILNTFPNNPLAIGILSSLKGVSYDPTDVQIAKYIEGKGITGLTKKGEVLLGKRLMLLEQGISVVNGEAFAQKYEEKGDEVIFIAINKKLAGIIAISRKPYHFAKDLIQDIKQLNVEPTLITTHSKESIEPWAKEIGITNIKVLEDIKSFINSLETTTITHDNIALLIHRNKLPLYENISKKHIIITTTINDEPYTFDVSQEIKMAELNIFPIELNKLVLLLSLSKELFIKEKALIITYIITALITSILIILRVVDSGFYAISILGFLLSIIKFTISKKRNKIEGEKLSFIKQTEKSRRTEDGTVST